jgi:hypothetical protein
MPELSTIRVSKSSNGYPRVNPSEGVKKLEDDSPDGEYLQKCRMRSFNLTVMDASKSSILRNLCIFVEKAGKGSRSTFLPISPALALSLGFFHTFSVIGGNPIPRIGVVSPEKT